MQPGRNDPCPCGSGKKYKKCCGVNAASTTVAPDVLRVQAVAAFQRGDFETSAARCRQWLQAAPNDFDAHHIMGLSELQSGRLSAAAIQLEKAAQLNPRNPFVLNNLAFTRQGLGELAEAEHCARAALAIDPQLADAHNNLGQILVAAGRMQEAIAAYHMATTIAPGNALFHYNLGAALQRDPTLHTEAESSYRQALALNSHFASAWGNLGALLLEGGRWLEASESLERARNLTPDDPKVLNNLGLVLQRLDDEEGAIRLFRRVIEIAHYPAAYSNLGVLLQSRGDAKGAVEAYLLALKWQPDMPQIAANLVDDDTREATLGLISNLLLPLNYGDSFSEADIFHFHTLWGSLAANDASCDAGRVCLRDHRQNGKIRIGYISPDIRRHPVGYFLRSIITSHDREKFEVFCYSTSSVRDDFTGLMVSSSDQFLFAADMEDNVLAERIRADGVDILIDLAGHTSGGRLRMFADRIAPLQMMYLGYPNTSGTSFIDYWITDPYAHAEDDVFHTEKLLRLPESFLCFGEFEDQILEHVPPAVQNGFVTFGSFNNLAKLSAPTVRLWASVLKAVPASRLRLKAQDFSGQQARRNVEALFHAHGIGRDRLVMEAHAKERTQHLDQYREIDIAFDPFPYNGATTTCEALWMGVPVLTLAGTTHRQRVSYSLLKNIDVEDTIAWNEDEYVTIAARLAQDLPALLELRQRVAQNIRGSILCDSLRFTRQFEAALRRAWDDYYSNYGQPAAAGH